MRSFDFDPDSVSCTQALRDRYYPHDLHWIVERGSILDSDYTGRLDKSDIVYSWGALHHTGAMWTAVDRAANLVAPSDILASKYTSVGHGEARIRFGAGVHPVRANNCL